VPFCEMTDGSRPSHYCCVHVPLSRVTHCHQYGVTNHDLGEALELLEVSRLISGDYVDEPVRSVHIVSPPFGSLQNKRLEVHIKVASSVAVERIVFDATGIVVLELPPDTQLIESKVDNIDPGSMFYTVRTVYADGTQETSAHGYLEFVVDETEIIEHRQFVERTQSQARVPSGGSPPPTPVGSRESRVNVCFFGADLMDGQRRIWLLQSEHMDRSRFRFKWILGQHQGGDLGDTATVADSSVRSQLKHLTYVEVLDSPGFEISLQELQDDPGDGGPPASAVWRGDADNLFRYAHQRLIKHKHVINEVRPQWCRRMYQRTRDVLLRGNCSIVVYGNTRLQDGKVGGDVVITDTARALGIPSVAELMNLFVSEQILPDVIVAPSAYALQHESIQAVLGNARSGVNRSTGATVDVTQQLSAKLVGVVIPPAVDTAHFDPTRYRAASGEREAHTYRHPACGEEALVPCVVVGFIARLAPGTVPMMCVHHCSAS
jgi:hypothetical protein